MVQARVLGVLQRPHATDSGRPAVREGRYTAKFSPHAVEDGLRSKMAADTVALRSEAKLSMASA